MSVFVLCQEMLESSKFFDFEAELKSEGSVGWVDVFVEFGDSMSSVEDGNSHSLGFSAEDQLFIVLLGQRFEIQLLVESLLRRLGFLHIHLIPPIIHFL